jgi:hypothetical protein
MYNESLERGAKEVFLLQLAVNNDARHNPIIVIATSKILKDWMPV